MKAIRNIVFLKITIKKRNIVKWVSKTLTFQRKIPTKRKLKYNQCLFSYFKFEKQELHFHL